MLSTCFLMNLPHFQHLLLRQRFSSIGHEPLRFVSKSEGSCSWERVLPTQSRNLIRTCSCSFLTNHLLACPIKAEIKAQSIVLQGSRSVCTCQMTWELISVRIPSTLLGQARNQLIQAHAGGSSEQVSNSAYASLMACMYKAEVLSDLPPALTRQAGNWFAQAKWKGKPGAQPDRTLDFCEQSL